MSDQERTDEIFTVLSETAVDGQWYSTEEILQMGQHKFPEWTRSNVNSSLPVLYYDDRVEHRHRRPSSGKLFEYMYEDQREFDPIEREVGDEPTTLWRVFKLLHTAGAFYEEVEYDGDIYNADGNIEKDGVVVYKGTSRGGNALTSRQIVKQLNIMGRPMTDKKVNRALSELHSRALLDRRKRFDKSHNVHEYWINQRGLDWFSDQDYEGVLEW